MTLKRHFFQNLSTVFPEILLEDVKLMPEEVLKVSRRYLLSLFQLSRKYGKGVISPPPTSDAPVNLSPGRGVRFDDTNWFFGNSGKTAARSAAVSCIPYFHQFRTLPENFSPRSYQVRSPGQVKWPYLKKYLGFRRYYSFWDINMKLSEVDKGISTYKMYVSDFFYFGDLRSGRFWDFIIIRQFGNAHSLFFRKCEWERAIYHITFIF